MNQETDIMNEMSLGTKVGKCFSKLGKNIGQFFVNFGKGFVRFFVNIGRSIAFGVTKFHRHFIDGSIGTKISYFICGAGNLLHGQVVKGLLFLLLQVGFILFMVLCPGFVGNNNVLSPAGYKGLINLQLHGFENKVSASGDLISSDSMLMLLAGLLTILVMILYVFVWILNINSSYASDLRVKEGKKPSTFREDWKNLLDSKFHVLMLTPTCIAALLFTVLPTVFMICMAFTTYNALDMEAAGTNLFHWNGFKNFEIVFSGSLESALGKEIANRFLPVLGWTLIWAFFATFTCYFGGIFLALLINKKGLHLKKVFRFCFVLTIAIPQFISLLAMNKLLSAKGPINTGLLDLGWITKAIPFLGLEQTGNNPALAKTIIIIVNMWLGIPYTMLMTSGILMNIPTDLYEAARVDGTSRPKMFFKITLPYVIFVTTPYLIGSFIGNINSFNTIFLLTGGKPDIKNAAGETYRAGGSDLLVTWLYKLTIENGDINTGAIIGIFTFAITATITLVTYRRTKAYKEEDTFQ